LDNLFQTNVLPQSEFIVTAPHVKSRKIRVPCFSKEKYNKYALYVVIEKKKECSSSDLKKIS